MDKVCIVITGSTRGIGLSMSREFLSRGCAVVISGRTEEAVQKALRALRTELPTAELRGFACDVRDPAQVQALWDHAERELGAVDHWISNAGIGQPTVKIWELPADTAEAILRTNVLGALSCARVAMHGMARRGRGAIWFMEGHGSDGSIRTGLSVYGASKRAVRYLAQALAQEARGTGIMVGALSPGIVITDFTMNQLDRSDHDRWRRTVKIFNILADKPGTVAAFLVPRILEARRSGTRIAWLTTRKVLYRFMTAGMARRRLIEE